MPPHSLINQLFLAKAAALPQFLCNKEILFFIVFSPQMFNGTAILLVTLLIHIAFTLLIHIAFIADLIKLDLSSDDEVEMSGMVSHLIHYITLAVLLSCEEGQVVFFEMVDILKQTEPADHFLLLLTCQQTILFYHLQFTPIVMYYQYD